jgi:alcohol dehydrogenase
MNKFQFFMPTRILFGKGALNDLHKQDLPGKKALIVISAGKSMKANGYLERVEKELEMSGVSYVLYDKILPNPVLRNVMEGASAAKANGCDFVIGLGGGSSMDSAKAIAIMAANPGDYWDYIGGISGKGLDIPNAPLPIVEITTTAGTGSEADPVAVITKEETNEKIGFGNEKTYPTLSVVDPELMMTVPPMLTAYQGFDALFHAAESTINKNEDPIGEMFALKAIEYLAKYLPTAVNDGSNEEARGYVALANTLAGFKMLCTSEHSMEHALSAYHHRLPHGAGLIMISLAYHQHFVDCHACDDLYIKMAKAMGVKDASKAQDFVDALAKLEKDCHVDNLKMSDYGITDDDLQKYVKNARGAMGRLFKGDPVPLTDDDILNIYKVSFR